MNGGNSTGTTGNCTCKCPMGYSGDNCQFPDACTGGKNGTKCKNLGTPIGVKGMCGCLCLFGFSGDYCEIPGACF